MKKILCLASLTLLIGHSLSAQERHECSVPTNKGEFSIEYIFSHDQQYDVKAWNSISDAFMATIKLFQQNKVEQAFELHSLLFQQVCSQAQGAKGIHGDINIECASNDVGKIEDIKELNGFVYSATLSHDDDYDHAVWQTIEDKFAAFCEAWQTCKEQDQIKPLLLPLNFDPTIHFDKSSGIHVSVQCKKTTAEGVKTTE